MASSLDTFSERMDVLIRAFFYILVFWLPFSPAVIESCVITAVALWMIKRVVIHRKNLLKMFIPPESFLNATIYLFLVFCVFSVVSSILWQESLANLITKILEWFAIYWLVLEAFKTKRQVYILLSILLVTAFVVGVDAFIQYYVKGTDLIRGFPISPDGRATASFKAPTGLGSFMAGVIPIAFSLFFLKSKNFYLKAVSVVLVTLFTGALIVTFTRGAWAGAFAAIASFLFGLLLLNKHFEIFKTALLTIVFLSIITVFPLLLNTGPTLKLIKRDNTVSWRLNVWKDTMHMIKDRPLFGHGVNTYMPIFQSYRRDGHNDPTYAHNCYVQMAAEMGLLGLGVFLWMIFKFFHLQAKNLKALLKKDAQLMAVSLSLLSAVFGFLVHSFFDTNLYALQLSTYLWLLIAIQVKTTQVSDISLVKE